MTNQHKNGTQYHKHTKELEELITVMKHKRAKELTPLIACENIFVMLIKLKALRVIVVQY